MQDSSQSIFYFWEVQFRTRIYFAEVEIGGEKRVDVAGLTKSHLYN